MQGAPWAGLEEKYLARTEDLVLALEFLQLRAKRHQTLVRLRVHAARVRWMLVFLTELVSFLTVLVSCLSVLALFFIVLASFLTVLVMVLTVLVAPLESSGAPPRACCERKH